MSTSTLQKEVTLWNTVVPNKTKKPENYAWLL